MVLPSICKQNQAKHNKMRRACSVVIFQDERCLLKDLDWEGADAKNIMMTNKIPLYMPAEIPGSQGTLLRLSCLWPSHSPDLYHLLDANLFSFKITFSNKNANVHIAIIHFLFLLEKVSLWPLSLARYSWAHGNSSKTVLNAFMEWRNRLQASWRQAKLICIYYVPLRT